MIEEEQNLSKIIEIFLCMRISRSKLIFVVWLINFRKSEFNFNQMAEKNIENQAQKFVPGSLVAQQFTPLNHQPQKTAQNHTNYHQNQRLIKNDTQQFHKSQQQKLDPSKLIKISRMQSQNPALKFLRAGSFRFVESHNSQMAPQFSKNQSQSEFIVEDFQINPNTSVLFLSLDFHIKKPLYIQQRFQEVYRQTSRKENHSRILLLLKDSDDEMNFLTDLQLECLHFQFQLLICWSFEEAGYYLRTMKQSEHRGQNVLKQGKKPQKLTNNFENQPGETHFEKASEVLGSIQKICMPDAQKLLLKYGSIKEVVLSENYGDFAEIDKMGKAKIESLAACFKGNIQI